MPPASNSESQEEPLSNLANNFAEAGEDSSHVVGPALVEDNDILESYLSTIPDVQGTRRVTRMLPCQQPFGRLVRPVLFTTVQRRPLGITTHRSPASTKCEIIEKLTEPHTSDLIELFFEKVNLCFPVFDKFSFQKLYQDQKQKISSTLLSNLYAIALIYWAESPKFLESRCPDIRFIWNQANGAIHSELFLSPGISTILSIVLNVSGRPSTSIFGNGGLIGTAVALSNASGLNRDPSSWTMAASEKSFRIRLWWLVMIEDRWCSLAYGTPLQIHHAQQDVPPPSIKDICKPNSPSNEVAAATVFICLATLTEVLGRYLEHVYQVIRVIPITSSNLSAEFELHLVQWENSLPEDVHRCVIQGKSFDIAGSANLCLAYLATKLLLRRVQLDLDRQMDQPEANGESRYPLQAQEAAEDIVRFVKDLRGSDLRGFWIPVHAFSLTSATTFLLRRALSSTIPNRIKALKAAKDMVNTLRLHRENHSWDLADNCLANYASIVDKIELGSNDTSPVLPDEFPDLDDFMNMDMSVLDDLFLGFDDVSNSQLYDFG